MSFDTRKSIKYLTTGGMTFGVEYGTFLIFVYVLSFKVWLAQATSYLIALIINFALLRYWTFHHQDKARLTTQVPKYLALAAFNLPVSTWIIEKLDIAHVKPFFAKLIVVALVASWNYIIYDKLIFKQHKPKPGTKSYDNRLD